MIDPDCYPDRTQGTVLTKFDPYFHDDGDGGLVCRVITDDGQVFNRAISREGALRMIADLALFVARRPAALDLSVPPSERSSARGQTFGPQE